MIRQLIQRCTLVAAGITMLGISTAQAAPPPPRKIIAITDATQNFGTTKRSINIYDVTDLSSPGVFGQLPLFSIWLGSEDDPMAALNHEDISSITVNPVNGNIYAVAFDSEGSGARTPDGADDTQGDLDLYRIDYQKLLADFVAGGSVKGKMYAPRVSPLWMDTNMSTVPDAGDVGFEQDHPDHVGTTVFVDDTIHKIGEVIRTEESAFFDSNAPRSRDLEFVNPETMVMLSENDIAFPPVPPFVEDLDHQIRLLRRRSTAPNPMDPSTLARDLVVDDDPGHMMDHTHFNEGGFNSPDNIESWESSTSAFLLMDTAPMGDPLDFSDTDDIAVVVRDGVVGAWVQDNDGDMGDDLSFFEVDITTNAPNGLKKELRLQAGIQRFFDLAENPQTNVTTDNGDLGFMQIDADGNLVIIESGFFDSGPMGNDVGVLEDFPTPSLPAEEVRVLRLDIADYDGADTGGTAENEVALDFAVNETEAWTASAFLPDPDDVNIMGDDDDIQVTESRFGVLDRGTGHVYLFDTESNDANCPILLPCDDAFMMDPDQAIADVYVFDPATGMLIYEETNAINHFNIRHGSRFLLRGDITGNGIVDENDINALAVAIDDPTLGGTVSAALGQEWYDLTGDGLLTGVPSQSDDAAAMVRTIMGTEFGDANLNGQVDAGDYTSWANGFGGTGFENGDFNLNLLVEAGDYTIWANNFGFNNTVAPSGPATVPEPSSLILLGLGGALLILRRRRRG